MKQNILITFFIIFAGCNSNPERQKIMVNKTVKVFSSDYHDQAENYTFKWESPSGPNNELINFDLKNDMLIFTPKIIGNYDIKLSIEDISEEIVAKQNYYFIAIPETTELAIIKPKKEIPSKSTIPSKSNISKEKKEKKKKINQSISKSNKKQKKQSLKNNFSNTKYALQISAWPSLEDARKHQLKLIENGFDAYTQRYYWKIKDELWYRVRVGNFSNKNEAIKIKKELEALMEIKVWMDIVSK